MDNKKLIAGFWLPGRPYQQLGWKNELIQHLRLRWQNTAAITERMKFDL